MEEEEGEAAGRDLPAANGSTNTLSANGSKNTPEENGSKNTLAGTLLNTGAAVFDPRGLQVGPSQPPYTLHPTPYTPHPTPYALRPTPYALRPTPHTLHPTPYTLQSTPSSLTLMQR